MAATSRSISVLQSTLTLLLFVLVTYSIHCDGRGITGAFRGPRHLRSHLFKRAAAVNEVDLPEASNTEPYGIGSPFTLPPFDSLPPVPLPDSSPSPPFCINPPGTPQTPPSTVPSPTGYSSAVSPPPSPSYYIPPTIPGQSPPAAIPSPPSYNFPAPPGAGLGPPVFLPPVIFPAPKAPPPPLNGSPSLALWCVAKPSVPDPIIREAMNYACGSGADCASIQPDGLCFEPNTLFAHASYAFNSYWQRTKVAGGSCSFGGIAMLVTVDPSFDGCHFVYY